MAEPAIVNALTVALAALLFGAVSLSAGVGLENLRGSFRSRYGEGKEKANLPGFGDNRKNYLENRLELEYSLNLIESGLTVESREPAEFGEDFTRLRKAYIQYAAESYLLRAGTLYGLVGQGLTLNLFEDRTLDLDNTIRGFQGMLQLDRFRFQGQAGTGNYTDYREPLVIDRHVLATLNIEYEPADGVTLGLNALHDRLTNRKDHKSADHVELEADIPTWIGGAFLGLTARQWEFFLEFSSKHTGYNRLSPQADDFYQLPIRMLSLERDVTGKGLYWSLGYSEKGYGFSLQYKNYQYNLARDFGSMVSSALDPASVLPYQNPPTVIKEHIYFLLKRFPLTPDPNNEVGFELEFNAQPTGSLALQASASVNSMADILLPVPGGRDSERHRGGFPLAPHLGTAYNPTYDSFIELRWRKGQRFQLNGGAGFRKITDYYVRGRYGDHTYIWTFPVEARLRWSRRFSTVLNLETQHVRDKTFPLALLGQTYWNNYIALSLSWAPVFSVTLSSEFTGEENELDKTQCWPLLATSLRLRKWGTLDLSYGKQRAGMVCSNGLCRYVPGFKGLRAELSMFF